MDRYIGHIPLFSCPGREQAQRVSALTIIPVIIPDHQTANVRQLPDERDAADDPYINIYFIRIIVK